jgi:hypothetical protein
VRAVALALLISTGAAGAVAGQGGVKARLAGRVPPAVAGAVQQLADSAATKGLPVEPLVEKAIEGGAKGVAPARVVSAVRGVLGRLTEAAIALRAPGVLPPDPDAIEAGAFALNAGLNSDQLRNLAMHTRAPYALAATLRVAATLAALGVPGNDAVRMVRDEIDAGRAPGDVLDLPRRVQMGVGGGASAAQGAGSARGAAHAPSGGRPNGSPPGQERSHKP